MRRERVARSTTKLSGDDMIKSPIVGPVEFCTKRPLWIVVLAVALAGGSAFYAARHFAIKTNVNDLISRDQPWAQRGIQFLNDFPQRDIIIVVDAPTPELVEQASAKLAAALRQHPDRFPAVSEPGSGSFIERNGLLFLPEGEVVRVTDVSYPREPFPTSCTVRVRLLSTCPAFPGS
jgi:uncharacterized protein